MCNSFIVLLLLQVYFRDASSLKSDRCAAYSRYSGYENSLPIARPGVSRHLRVLREAGLVEVRRDAQRRLYRLNAEPLRELDAWLEPYRAELAGRLDALERHLERTARPTSPKERSL